MSEYPGQTAGPSFELFYESDYLLPHRDAAWALMAERLDVAAGFAQEIIIGDTGAGGPVLTPEQVAAGAGDPVPASERVAAVIEPVGAALAGLAGALAAFLPPSDPHSPAATGPDSVRTAAPADPDLAALAARANDFHLTGPDGLRPGDLTADLAQDIEQAWLITSELLAPGSRADRHWAAARLVDSVLRPLADTLRATTTTQPAPSAPANANPATANPAGADERIWQLAQDVTRQHVRWAQAGTAPAGLAEATAGLQGIACDLAPGADRRAAFRELQAALPTGIQVAPDGPYLVTNVATVHDYLGQDVPVPPQLALCRCGASGRKPFCDGSHAASGFTGDKDPKRVPDHRDRYDGEQVTVFDNRGICQHSGFCTDRLSAVFRTDAEPFVAPSGGRMDEIIRAVRDCPSGALGLALDGREQRDLADWHGDRPAVIEISKDGPYRVTGGITLTGPDGAGPDGAGPAGADVPRAQGASREHYALCRCGHSQNKPFCSGMHWYIGFSHPDVAPGRVPSLFEWAGGLPALTQLTRRLYEKLIPADPQLARGVRRHPSRLPRTRGSQDRGRVRWPAPGPARRLRVTALVPAPNRPRSSGPVGCCWPPRPPTRWGCPRTWSSGPPSPRSWPGTPQARWPGVRPAAHPRRAAGRCGATGLGLERRRPARHRQQPDTEEADQPVTLPGPDEPVSFADGGGRRHIKPMFRAKDRQSMLFALDLWSYDAVRTHAADVLARVANGSMPCDGSWPQAQVEVFRRWTESGNAGVTGNGRCRCHPQADCPFTIDRPILRQRWERLTYLHWALDPAAVQRLLPPGLTAETWDGAAWVGLVPFYMRVATPAGQRVPWVSNFCETNIRTYVRDGAGRSGIWFFSLDASRLGAVLVARATPYRLPYFWSTMRLGQRGNELAYLTHRHWPRPAPVTSRVRVTVGDPIPADQVSELEHFLTARWMLFSVTGGRRTAARVCHQRWPLHRATAQLVDDQLLTATGLPAPDGEPLVHYSPGVDVAIGRPER